VSTLFRLALDGPLRPRGRATPTIGAAAGAGRIWPRLLGLRRAQSVSAEADLAQYAVEEA
jgi:hypothetical protein